MKCRSVIGETENEKTCWWKKLLKVYDEKIYEKKRAGGMKSQMEKVCSFDEKMFWKWIRRMEEAENNIGMLHLL